MTILSVDEGDATRFPIIAQLCVGLDPDLHKIPNDLPSAKRPIFEFNNRIVDSAKNYCKIFKPQAAFYHAVGAEDELSDTIRYIREEVPDSEPAGARDYIRWFRKTGGVPIRTSC